MAAVKAARDGASPLKIKNSADPAVTLGAGGVHRAGGADVIQRDGSSERQAGRAHIRGQATDLARARE